MAKARKVVGDQNSEELDVLRRCVHTMLIMLENLGTDLAAATLIGDVNDVGTGLQAAISSGLDSAATSYTGSGLEIAGVNPTPKHPKRPQSAAAGALKDLDPNNL